MNSEALFVDHFTAQKIRNPSSVIFDANVFTSYNEGGDLMELHLQPVDSTLSPNSVISYSRVQITC